MKMTDHKEKDDFTGVETTGHEWDGLKELNNPAPRWWLWVFFITIIWSIGYWVIYPAWPTLTGSTQGSAEWTSYKKLSAEQDEIIARRGEFAKLIKTHTLEEILQNKELYAFAIAGGKTMFKENCAACHGTGAEGRSGYPNLNDDDWLWGGTIQDIYTTIKVGVRSDHAEMRQSQMPAFGEMLSSNEIDQVATHVLSLSGKAEASPEGAAIYTQNCAACHGEQGQGDHSLGAPNLADAIWLYGNNKGHIASQIRNPRHGVMPTWEQRLPDETIKQLTIYVYSLGGGEAAKPRE